MEIKISTFRLLVFPLGAPLLAVFCVGCQLFGGDSAQENRNRLEARLAEFSQIPPREQLTEPPYIKGRALIITKRQEPPGLMREDPVYWGGQDPDKVKALMAETPEQVETVVLLNYSKEKAGSYNIVGASGGVAAFREVCELIVVDRSLPAVIHRKIFKGPDPLSSTSINQKQADVVTSVDLNTLRNYIVNIPRK